MGRCAVPFGLFLLVSATTNAAIVARPGPHPVVIANWSGRPVRELYLSPATSQDWGVNRLDGRLVAPDDDVRLSYGGACQADLRVVFDNGGAEERRDLDVCRARYIGIRPGWTTADDPAGETPPALVPVLNRSGRTVARFYLFADGADDEGADRLGHDVLLDGADINVLRPIAATCDFSLRVVFEDGSAEQRQGGIDLCRHHGIIIEQPSRPR